MEVLRGVSGVPFVASRATSWLSMDLKVSHGHDLHPEHRKKDHRRKRKKVWMRIRSRKMNPIRKLEKLKLQLEKVKMLKMTKKSRTKRSVFRL